MAPAGGWIRQRRRRRASGRRRARKGSNSPSRRFLVFQKSTACCVEHFVCLGRGRRGTDLNLVSTRESAKEHAKCAKAMGRPWNHSTRMAHGDPRPAHAHYHHEISDRLFFSFFLHQAAVQHMLLDATDFCRVCRKVVYSSWGTTPRNFQFSGAHGGSSCSATCQITRKDGAITGI